MLDFLWRGPRTRTSAQKLYTDAVEQARNARFYDDYGVPDSVDGRFDMITLHVILIMLRLSGDRQGAKVNQALFDVMFRDMDKALREMAIGDLSVPKHMKRMMNGFNGRLQHYKSALSGDEELADVLRRNVYGTLKDPDKGQIGQMEAYVRAAYKNLEGVEIKKILDAAGYYPEL